MLRLHTLALACAPLLVSTAAGASIINLHATLTNTQEIGGTPPAATTPFTQGPGLGGDPRPVSSGTAHFVLDTTLNFMTMTVTVFDIDVTGTQTAYTNDDLVNAHIHAPAPPGSNASVRWGFFGSPDHDITPKQLVVTPFAVGVGGTFTSTWDTPEGAGGGFVGNESAILAGLSYINFHTIQFPNGEIRGQILVPEPATFALMGLGLLGLAGLRRKSA